MLHRSLTKENINKAQQNGEAQFRQMMRSMGYEHVSIRFEN